MEFKAKDIAALLSGVVDGDPEISVNNVSKIEEGKKKKSIVKVEKEIHFTDIKEVKDIVVF